MSRFSEIRRQYFINGLIRWDSSSWGAEVHSNSWLSDLKAGKAPKILQEVRLNCELKPYFDKPTRELNLL